MVDIIGIYKLVRENISKDIKTPSCVDPTRNHYLTKVFGNNNIFWNFPSMEELLYKIAECDKNVAGFAFFVDGHATCLIVHNNYTEYFDSCGNDQFNPFPTCI
jgi:hypothetical protein